MVLKNGILTKYLFILSLNHLKLLYHRKFKLLVTSDKHVWQIVSSLRLQPSSVTQGKMVSDGNLYHAEKYLQCTRVINTLVVFLWNWFQLPLIFSNILLVLFNFKEIVTFMLQWPISIYAIFSKRFCNFISFHQGLSHVSSNKLLTEFY